MVTVRRRFLFPRAPGTSLALAVAVFMLCGTLHAQPEPLAWRGLYLFGMPEPTDRGLFFRTLRDSLHVNVIVVRTYGDPVRADYFLKNDYGIWVITQDNLLASMSETPGIHARDDGTILRRARSLSRYPQHLRFYLRDEPDSANLSPFLYVSRRLEDSLRPAGLRSRSVAAIAQPDRAIASYVALTKPPELIIDPYYITNDIPHPSLRGRDRLAMRSGIRPWGDSREGYGWYFGFMAQAINDVLKRHVRPAAHAVSGSATRLVMVPQIHGVFDRTKKKYDRDDSYDRGPSLRPPSPEEIRLQVNIGLAYGAKGFIAFPYGFDAGYDREAEIYPGLVSSRPSGVDHASDFDTVFGVDSIWTGYREKWAAVGESYKRLDSIAPLLSTLSWVAAKSWSMTPAWTPATSQTARWDSNLVIACSASVTSGYHNELPQVEVGHLRAGAVDHIVVVNRRTAPEDMADITLTLSRRSKWQIADIEHPGRQWQIQAGGQFTDHFAPGEGKIYRVRPQ